MKKTITLAVILVAIICFGGCVKQNVINDIPQEQPEQTVSEKSCQKDDDCACGRHKKTRECFFGNAKYVDTSKQCPDFCSGIDGRMKVRCINNECWQTRE